MDHVNLICRNRDCRKEFKKLAPNQVYCTKECAPFGPLLDNVDTRRESEERLRAVLRKQPKLDEAL